MAEILCATRGKLNAISNHFPLVAQLTIKLTTNFRYCSQYIKSAFTSLLLRSNNVEMEFVNKEFIECGDDNINNYFQGSNLLAIC